MDEKYAPKHPIRKGSETWNLLMEQNRFDIHLYDYAKELFVQQSFIFGLQPVSMSNEIASPFYLGSTDDVMNTL